MSSAAFTLIGGRLHACERVGYEHQLLAAKRRAGLDLYFCTALQGLAFEGTEGAELPAFDGWTFDAEGRRTHRHPVMLVAVAVRSSGFHGNERRRAQSQRERQTPLELRQPRSQFCFSSEWPEAAPMTGR